MIRSGKAKQDIEKSLSEMRQDYQDIIALIVQAEDGHLQSEAWEMS